MAMNFKTGIIKFHKATVLRSNMGQNVCFSGVWYPVQNITARPNGIDFEFNKHVFRDVDSWRYGVEFIHRSPPNK